MDFIPQREFFHPHVNTKMKRKSTADNVSKSYLLMKFNIVDIYIKLCICTGGAVPVRGPIERSLVLLEEEEHGVKIPN